MIYQVALGLLLTTGWFVVIGVPWRVSITFITGGLSATFLGISRILSESGLAVLRAQMITPARVLRAACPFFLGLIPG